MIPEYMEPKGLERDTPDFDDVTHQELFRYHATTGSRNLLDAILAAQGHKLPPRPPIAKPKIRTKPSGKPSLIPTPIGHEGEVERIRRITANFYGVALSEMVTTRRKAARVRQIAMYFARELTPMSLPQIGRRFGGRDHTTVAYGIERIEAAVAADPIFAAEIDALREALA